MLAVYRHVQSGYESLTFKVLTLQLSISEIGRIVRDSSRYSDFARRLRTLRGSTCVAIFPDRGERYLDTIYSRQWVEEKFGEIPNLWPESIENFEQVAQAV